MKVVLDTNVLISATLVQGGNEDRLLRAWRRGAFELVLSPPILGEILRALSYPKIRQARWLRDEEVSLLVESLAAESLVVPGNITVNVCRDPEDDKFLSAALEGDAKYVVTGDKDLLTLKTYRNVQIVTPGVFLTILRQGEQR